jgi:cell division transport system ATP-binding protein
VDAPLIEMIDVTKVYPNGTVALDKLNLQIQPKEFVSIVGASGAGKTTLIKTLMHEELPTSGSIFIEGVDITGLKASEVPLLRRRTGTVFQDYKLLPQKTVYENVAFSLEVSGERGSDIHRKVPRVLQLVGLLKKSGNFPTALSGGERQRVAIARALVRQPPILIADEPTGNLDPGNAWEIIELLVKINRYGTTVLLTTHNKDIVNALKRRVISISKGRVVLDQARGRYAI